MISFQCVDDPYKVIWIDPNRVEAVLYETPQEEDAGLHKTWRLYMMSGREHHVYCKDNILQKLGKKVPDATA